MSKLKTLDIQLLVEIFFYYIEVKIYECVLACLCVILLKQYKFFIYICTYNASYHVNYLVRRKNYKQKNTKMYKALLI